MDISENAPASKQRPALALYVRRDCHLCEEMEAMLTKLAKKLGYAWQPVFIDGDPELEQRYGESIPVLAVDGTPLLYAPFTLQQARTALQKRLASL
jgi:hypothetical protein